MAAAAMSVLGWGLMTVGAVVRTTDSGLGCPDWPACHGKIVAGGHHALIEEFHRWIATVLIVGLIAIAVLVFRHHRRDRRLVRQTLWVLAMLVLQVVLGGITVLLKNVSWTVVMHYGGAAALVISVALLAVKLAYPVADPAPRDGFARLVTWLTALTYALLLVGSTVANTDSGTACGKSYPLCNGSLAPTLDHKIVLDIVHRLGVATLIVLAVVIVARAGRDRPRQPVIRTAAHSVAGMFVLVAILGAVFVTVGDHVSTAVIHSSGASLLWLAVAYLYALTVTLPAAPQTADEPERPVHAGSAHAHA